MEEKWKDVVEYEGIYKVSNTGKVWSIRNNRLLKTKKNNRDYIQVNLSKDGVQKTHLLHRVVAIAFIENPNCYPQVNHKDENKNNNCVDNLEWCTNKYNRNYGTGYARSVANRNHIEIGKKMSRRVNQYDDNGNLVYSYYGVKEAERKTGINESNIRRSMIKKYKAGGYIWRYADTV